MKTKAGTAGISLLAVLTAILFLVPVSFAVSEDFSATAGKKIYVGECSTVTTTMVVRNTGTITSLYSVRIEGDAEKWTSIAPQAFTLKPGESEQVFFYIKAPCGSEGSYSLKTYISTKLGIEKALNQEVSVHKTKNIEIIPAKYSDSVNPCNPAVFTFTANNTGTFMETYTFSAEPFGNRTQFSVNPLILMPEESAPVTMTVSPECSTWGNYSIELYTETKLSKAGASTESFSLEINRAYDYSLSFGKFQQIQDNQTPDISAYSGQYNLCEYESGIIPVLVSNNADISNTYNFEIEAPEWVSASGYSASIEPGKPAYIMLGVRPPEPMEHNSTIKINAVSELGEIEKTISKEIKLDICRIPEIAEGVSRIKTYYNESSVELGIRNTGSKPADYSLSVSGADWISISPSAVHAESGETATFALNLMPTEDTAEGKYDVSVRAVSGTVAYEKKISVYIKEPRFTNMLFDEYLPYTIIAIVLVLLCSAGMGVFAVYLEKTKDRRVAASAERRKKAEKRKLEKEKAKARKEAERQRKKLIRQKEIEKRKSELAKKKAEKEKKRLAEKKEHEKKILASKKEKIRKSELNLNAALSAQPKKKKSRIWAFIIFAALVIASSAVIAYAVYLGISYYIAFIIGGFASLLIILAIIFIGEHFTSRWYKKHVWNLLVPGQKGVVEISWSKGLGEIVVKLKKKAENPRIKIKKLSRQPTFIAPEGKVYQYFEVRKENFTNSDIDRVTFRFRVNKKWLKKNSVPEESIRFLRYNNESWTGIQTSAIKNDRKYVYYEASVASCSMFAIVGKQKIQPQKKKDSVKKVAVKPAKSYSSKTFKKEKKNSSWLIWLLVIFLLLAAGGLVFAGVYYYISGGTESYMPEMQANETAGNESIIPENETNNITAEIPEEETAEENISSENETIEAPEDESGIQTQVWDEDEQKTINLSNYFVDPDNDALTFTNSELEHISVSYEEGIATLTPDKNWFGTETVVFTAHDGKGGSASSNPVRLVVNDAEEPPFIYRVRDAVSSYSNYVIVGVLLLIILILLIEFRKPVMRFLDQN